MGWIYHPSHVFIHFLINTSFVSDKKKKKKLCLLYRPFVISLWYDGLFFSYW